MIGEMKNAGQRKSNRALVLRRGVGSLFVKLADVVLEEQNGCVGLTAKHGTLAERLILSSLNRHCPLPSEEEVRALRQHSAHLNPCGDLKNE
jgi:hypothetical protein